MAGTHSRYWKLTTFHPSSVSAISVVDDQLQSKSKSNSPIIISIKNLPKLLANTQHTCLFSTSHCYVVFSNRILPHFPTFHIVFHLPFLTATSNRVETITMLKPSSARIRRWVTRYGFLQLGQSWKIPTSGFLRHLESNPPENFSTLKPS